MSYQTEYDRSMQDPAGFWGDQAKALEWYKTSQKVLTTDADGIGHWFADGEMNTAYMALDHHVKTGRGDQTAIIYDSPVTSTKRKYTYAELTDEGVNWSAVYIRDAEGRFRKIVFFNP